MPILNQGSSSQLKMRLIIAALIAGVAIISYLMKFERDPITGEMRAVAMSPEQEIAMGLQAAPEMARQMGGAINPANNRDAQFVASMGAKLVDAYEQNSKSSYARSFNFYLLADRKTVNAFALPGGQIFITEALFDRLENEAQLAGVLGHEIGHVIHRHASEHMAKGELGQSLVGAVAVGAGDQGTAQIANMVNQMVQMRYGRKDELQSDGWGLETMVKAGYDPKQMVRVMQILKEASGGASGPAIFASHPNPDQRIEEIKQYIDARWPNGVPDVSAGAALH